jgi:putative exporter of polyketide antibiotics
MFGLLAARNKERERFYLLPGMGGSALRRKRKVMLQWSIVAGLLVSAIVASLLYLLYDRMGR